VSCHVWDGQLFADPDPGAIGPDLTRVVGRIRQSWFDRFLENPQRLCPGTPMPSAFQRGRPATLSTVLDGDAAIQRQALWDYLGLGRNAPAPKPAPPLPVAVPEAGEPAIVAQIPLRVFDNTPLECIALLTADHDLAVYDLAAASLRSVRVGGQILRHVHGRVRTYTADGRAIGADWLAEPAWQWKNAASPALPIEQIVLRGYDRVADGVRIRSEAHTTAGNFTVAETIRIQKAGGGRRLSRLWRLHHVPNHSTVILRTRSPAATSFDSSSTIGTARVETVDDVWTVSLQPDTQGTAACRLHTDLPDAEAPEPASWTTLANPPLDEESLARPGYRATVYPSPKGPSGEDLIVPVAVAAHPVDGRVFVASMKLGEIFVLEDPTGDGRYARFIDYARGLFQDAYSMLAEEDALYVLHRRNLSRLTDTDSDGRADRVDRVFAIPHGIADTYDYAYGLVRDRDGAFVFSYAPYANRTLAGSGGAVRLPRGEAQVEPLAFGFRNPLGWSSGPEGTILFTDNQGEWVATNKLCVLTEGHFYGFPNPEQPEHVNKPRGKTAVWVPYGWAHSINGLTYDNSGGKFGPFGGQVFMAELMFGGAIIRANLEKIDGVYQGACFPFWSKGLLGPTALAMDPAGRMWVASLTEPGWMAQPDRGAVFRIDFTGELPFEMQSIHVQPDGFRIQFTRPVDVPTAGDPTSYGVESYRYEYTGAYGSPELDRTAVPVRQAIVSADRKSVLLVLPELVTDRVYMITAAGVHSPDGESLVHAAGAYTLHEVPDRRAATVQQP
jgi:glucose/arabinose dehydrogenase